MTDSAQRAFAAMAGELINGPPSARPLPYISQQQYDRFCYEYLFDAIRGLTFGQAFCKKFSIHDVLLIHTIRDEQEAKRYIRGARYVETQVD